MISGIASGSDRVMLEVQIDDETIYETSMLSDSENWQIEITNPFEGEPTVVEIYIKSDDNILDQVTVTLSSVQYRDDGNFGEITDTEAKEQIELRGTISGVVPSHAVVQVRQNQTTMGQYPIQFDSWSILNVTPWSINLELADLSGDVMFVLGYLDDNDIFTALDSYPFTIE